MNKKEFAKYLERDGSCYCCGETEAVAIQHRLNRGMGGKNSAANRVSNLMVLCSVTNGLVESDVVWQARARSYGWKLGQGSLPERVPVFEAHTGLWWLLDDDYGRVLVDGGSFEAL